MTSAARTPALAADRPCTRSAWANEMGFARIAVVSKYAYMSLLSRKRGYDGRTYLELHLLVTQHKYRIRGVTERSGYHAAE